MTDNVNSPAHYTHGKIECIDIIDEMVSDKSGMETECTVCGFPSEDGSWCEACEAIYQAKDPNFYDLGGSDVKE